MEIKLNTGDRINIPENCKAIIEDNQIIIEEQKEFKDGDILHSKATGTIAIFKEYKNEFSIDFYSHYHNQGNCSSTWKTSSFRHATEEEKQKFFDELNEKSLRWNEEIKKMEKIRKRVSYEDTYLHINQFLEVVETEDCITPHDDYNYNSGNYYLLEERGQAEADAQKIRAIFQERLK
jgi:hypothetical protein|nr:MAG TPA: hypothetical protein [Bacteriophage sp.]